MTESDITLVCEQSRKERILLMIIGVILSVVLVALLILTNENSKDKLERNANAKARCESMGGKIGYLKCYKNGREI
jgi:hypothetical protein|nr:MAG TPA: hypothetical protein [Caudoviricetes sp.]